MPQANKADPDVTLADRTFSSREVCRIANLSLRQLQWWDERKVVSPSHEGHRRVYLPEEVVTVALIAELRRKGFSLQKLRRVVRFLHREMREHFSNVLDGESDLHLLTDGKAIYLEDRPGRVVDLLKTSRQPMLLVCVSDQAKRLTMPAKKPVRPATSQAGRKARTG
jgi:DNA-binding transcriptional MerR regulator